MLRVTQQSAPAAAKSYYTHADYYGDGLENVGRWGGKGAERLGLTGQVTKAAFDALCDNRTPGTGEPLTARTRTDRTVGYDFTFSVPKSVSLAYAVGGDERVLDAVRAAVAETMADVEAEMTARVRKGGADAERTTGNAVWAEFVHLTSRPVGGIPDPHLHAHCFVFNATHDPAEDAWKASQFRDLKRDAPYWQAAFRVRLADRLQDLGYALTRTRDDFELAGVSAEVVARFSRRTGEIDAEAERRGITDPERKAELGAKTRTGKAGHLSRTALTAIWSKRLTPDEVTALRPGEPTARTHAPDRDATAVAFAVRHLFERRAVVPERTLQTEALKAGLGEVTVEGVARAAKSAGLLAAEHDGRRVVTTRGVLAEEEKLLAFARGGRGTRRPLGPPGWAVRRGWLNEGQKRAVEHVLASRDRVTLLTGQAGTGKTTLMQEAVEAIEAAGRRVVVLAPSAAASRGVLRSEGFGDADTVAAFLARRELQQAAAGQVIWVDEAGLLGSRDLAALFAVAKAVDARVVLMGDRAQHGSVARGSPLRLLQTEAGLPSAAVTDIVRQSGDYKGAVKLMADGRTGDGLAALDRLGWVREVADPAERYRQMAVAYREATAGGKTALVVTPTHAEAAKITAAVRADRAAANQLGESRSVSVLVPKHLTEAERERASSYSPGDVLQFHRHTKGHPAGSRTVVGLDPLPLGAAERFTVYRPATIELAAGDRVRVTANGTSTDGHRLANGSLYTLAGFTPKGDLVLDNGWVVAKEFGHLAHGYAVTSHAGQGKTVDRVIVVQSAESFPASDRRQFYVSVSRGRENALVFTDDRRGLAAAVARGGEGATATEVFRRRPRPAVEWLARHLTRLRRAADLLPPVREPARGPEREGRHG